jgi:hypothetical protein
VKLKLDDLKMAVFNRIKDAKATEDEPSIYEFTKPLVFYMNSDRTLIYNKEYGIEIHILDSEPEIFYSIVLDNIKNIYKEGKLKDCKVFKNSEMDDFNSYFNERVEDERTKNSI